ncbi:MAG: hypothetical protein ACN6O7_20450 [Sphingobacterium sp.]
MKLLESIINDLVVTKVSLSDPLLKTKVLASRIRNQQLLDWVNSEVNGYGEEDSVPNYRAEYGILKGNYLNGYWQYTDAQIPLPNISSEIKETYTKIECRDSIEAVCANMNSENLGFSVSNDRKAFLENKIRELGYDRFQILSLHIQIPVNFNSNIISNVRSKLLEFMLALEQEFGVEADIITLSKNNQTITHIMNTTINNSGDGAVINNGDNNNIETNITVNQGNKDALKTKLIEEKVTVNDAEELIKIIDKSTPVSKDNFGEPVNNWVQTMIGKALNGSWQVAIGAAGNILAQAIQAYYGLK